MCTQGYIYNKIKKLDIHDNKDYKFFTFSNLFPINNQKISEGKIYSLIISSPDEKIINQIFYNSPIGEQINLGEYLFNIKDIRIEKSNIIKDFSILRTPVMINITKREGIKYKSLVFSKDSEFLELLNNNLLSKYNKYYHEKNNINLFKNCKVSPFGKGSVVLRINSYKGDFNIIGNILEFKFGLLNKKQREILNFNAESGFGERTSYGLGFINNIKNNNIDDINDFNLLTGEINGRN